MNRREQVAAYALGELSGAEREEFEALLLREPDLQAEVEATQAAMVALEDLPGEAWPTGAVEPTGAVQAERPAVPAAAPPIAAPARPAREVGRRRRLTIRPAWAVAAVLVAAAIGGGIGALLASGDDSASAPPTAIVLRPLDAPATARGDISMPDAETMLLDIHGLPSSAPGDYYEVWLMNDDESLVSVASFRVGSSGSATVEVPLPADPGSYHYFDVSRQTISGGLAHSGDSVLRGPT